jgi:ribosome-associated protein
MPIQLSDSDVHFEFSRSGGAGGQNVNKRNTQTVLYFPVSKSNKLSDEQKRILLCQSCVAQNNEMLQKIWNRVNGAGNIVIKTSTERTQEGNRSRALYILNYEINEALKIPEPRIIKIPKKVKAKRRAVGMKMKTLKYKEQRMMK